MLSVRVKVRDRDRGARALTKRLRTAGKKIVKVGIFGDAAGDPKDGGNGELTLIQVAAFHEFGRGNNPERSFIRTTVDAQDKAIRGLQRRIGKGIIKRKLTEEQGLGLLGAFLKAEIQKTIQAGISPELKEATRVRKGSTTPLIDTGQLIQSIAWEVDGA